MNVALMTCPPRVDGIEPILRHLPADTKVFNDEEFHGPAWQMERIFKEFPGGVLIIQDDVEIEDWFMGEVKHSMVKGQLMSYHTGHRSARGWMLRAMHYARTYEVMGQANFYPKEFIKAYWQWTKHVPPLPEFFMPAHERNASGINEHAYRLFGMDDSCVTACLLWHGKKAWITVPNLCNHRIDLPSTIRANVPEAWRSTIFEKPNREKWDRTKVIDTIPQWRVARFTHPDRKAKS